MNTLHSHTAALLHSLSAERMTVRIATRCAQKRTAAVHTRRTVFKSLYCPGGRRQRHECCSFESAKKHCEIAEPPKPARSQTHLSLLHSVSVCCTNAGCLPGLALGAALRSRSLRVKKVRALCAEPEEQSPKETFKVKNKSYTQQSQAELL